MDIVELGAQVNHAVEAWRFPAATAAFRLFSFLGSVSGYMLLIPLYCWAISLRNGCILYSGFLVCNYLNVVLKDTIRLDRPFVHHALNALERPESFSFPSGHSQMVAFVWVFVYFKHRNASIKALAALFIGATGFSRVYLGAHYFFDVLAGWILGAILALLMRQCEHLFRFFSARMRKIPVIVGLLAFLGASMWVFPTELMFASVGGTAGLLIALWKNPAIDTLLEGQKIEPTRIGIAYLGMLGILALHSAFPHDAPRFAIYALSGIWVLWIAPRYVLKTERISIS